MTDFYRGMFLYRGEALGVAGTSFNTQAPSVIPTIGGRSEAEVCGFNHSQSGVKCEYIASRASGSFNEASRTYETSVEVRLRGLSIDRRFAMEEGHIGISSRHSQRESDEMAIRLTTPERLVFEFAGYKAEVTFHTGLLALETRSQFIKALAQPDFKKEHNGRFYCSSAAKISGTTRQEIYTEAGGYLIYSPVARIAWEGARHEGNQVNGHVLVSPKVGRCYVAETYRDGISVRSNLLRFEFGSLAAGEQVTIPFIAAPAVNARSKADGDTGSGIAAGGVSSNGVIIPP